MSANHLYVNMLGKKVIPCTAIYCSLVILSLLIIGQLQLVIKKYPLFSGKTEMLMVSSLSTFYTVECNKSKVC